MFFSLSFFLFNNYRDTSEIIGLCWPCWVRPCQSQRYGCHLGIWDAVLVPAVESCTMRKIYMWKRRRRGQGRKEGKKEGRLLKWPWRTVDLIFVSMRTAKETVHGSMVQWFRCTSIFHPTSRSLTHIQSVQFFTATILHSFGQLSRTLVSNLVSHSSISAATRPYLTSQKFPGNSHVITCHLKAWWNHHIHQLRAKQQSARITCFRLHMRSLGSRKHNKQMFKKPWVIISHSQKIPVQKHKWHKCPGTRARLRESAA